MPVYENHNNAENRIILEAPWRESIVFGTHTVLKHIIELLKERFNEEKRTITVAFDGWYGVDWATIASTLRDESRQKDIPLELCPVHHLFKTGGAIATYKRLFTTGEDDIGFANTSGRLQDLMNMEEVSAMNLVLRRARSSGTPEFMALVVYGCGAAISELNDSYDLHFYFDCPQPSILLGIEKQLVVPFGRINPIPTYTWKEYASCDFYLLDRQKAYALQQMDYWVDSSGYNSLKLVPRPAYSAIISSLLSMPIKQAALFEPGVWGGSRYKDYTDIQGLENNAGNQTVGANLTILVDLGLEEFLELPLVNLMGQADLLLGTTLAATFPRLFPLDVWLNDGYFPQPQPAEKTMLPLHLHPGTSYINRHYNEPIGRYESHYIAEAYEGASLWLGYQEDADLDDWESRCQASAALQPIPEWQSFLANWETHSGDLFHVLPGSVHASAGNQVEIVVGTVGSAASAEYTFMIHDFARPTWDEAHKSFTGDPFKINMQQAFNCDRGVRSEWVRQHCIARQKVVRWTKEDTLMRYASVPAIPYEVESLHFNKQTNYSTEGRFLHILTLAAGERIAIRSVGNKQGRSQITRFQSILIPACLGEYELVNAGEGACTVVLVCWKNG